MSLPRAQIWMLAILLLLAGSCSPPRGIYHTVERGQTLYQISRSYGLGADELARVNRIKDPTELQVGTRLFIPGATEKRKVEATLSKAARPPAVESVRPPPPPRSKPSPSARSSPKMSVTPASAPAFIWPLKGKVLKEFSDKGSPPSKGVEIAAREGADVMAAAPGQVIYSGDGITSFGNLVIIKHAGGFYSVYGYNRSNLVQAGSFVGQGDFIARAGTAPSGGSPRLYFEIRNGKNPVNPIFFLP